jgi:hypothetical protein
MVSESYSECLPYAPMQSSYGPLINPTILTGGGCNESHLESDEVNSPISLNSPTSVNVTLRLYLLLSSGVRRTWITAFSGESSKTQRSRGLLTACLQNELMLDILLNSSPHVHSGFNERSLSAHYATFRSVMIKLQRAT